MNTQPLVHQEEGGATCEPKTARPILSTQDNRGSKHDTLSKGSFQGGGRGRSSGHGALPVACWHGTGQEVEGSCAQQRSLQDCAAKEHNAGRVHAHVTNLPAHCDLRAWRCTGWRGKTRPVCRKHTCSAARNSSTSRAIEPRPCTSSLLVFDLAASTRAANSAASTCSCVLWCMLARGRGCRHVCTHGCLRVGGCVRMCTGCKHRPWMIL